MGEHPASQAGGWGIRMWGGKLMPHPSGSSLNCYSLGDVQAFDSKEEAERYAHDVMLSGLYERVTVEPVEKGQRQASIYEEQHALEIGHLRSQLAAVTRERDEARGKLETLEMAAIKAIEHREKAEHDGGAAVAYWFVAERYLDEFLAALAAIRAQECTCDDTRLKLANEADPNCPKHGR
jgi:hypothetical protein